MERLWQEAKLRPVSGADGAAVETRTPTRRLENDMDPAIRELFRQYEAAFNRLDIEKQVEFFADTFISAGPRGTIAQSRDEFMKMSRQAAEYYRSVGQTGARILDIEERPISDGYSMVPVRWAATFEKTGGRPIEFDVTYFVQKTGEKPQIIMFIAHQDEEQAMKDLGLL
jgi:ketosteroid isomerase-like protein